MGLPSEALFCMRGMLCKLSGLLEKHGRAHVNHWSVDWDGTGRRSVSRSGPVATGPSIGTERDPVASAAADQSPLVRRQYISSVNASCRSLEPLRQSARDRRHAARRCAPRRRGIRAWILLVYDTVRAFCSMRHVVCVLAPSSTASCETSRSAPGNSASMRCSASMEPRSR